MYIQKHNITIHIKAQHDMIGYSCTTCHKSFSNFTYRKRHKENSHYLKNGERSRLVFDCQEADIVGLDEVLSDAFKAHSDTAPDPYLKQTKTIKNQNKKVVKVLHLEKHTDKVHAKCDHCDFVATSKDNLLNHVKFHHSKQ